METISNSDIAEFAAQFLDNLDEQPPRDHYAAIIIAAGLDADGEVDVMVQTTSEHAMVNIQVLQEAQIVQTLALVKAAREAGGS